MERRPHRWVLRHVDLDLVNPAEASMELVVRQTIEVVAPTRTLDFVLLYEVYDGDKLQSIRIDGRTQNRRTSGQHP